MSKLHANIKEKQQQKLAKNQERKSETEVEKRVLLCLLLLFH